MLPRLTPALDQAIALFLSIPLSEDTHGYAHFIPVEYFETLRGAYLSAIPKRTTLPSGVRETVLLRQIRQGLRPRATTTKRHRNPT